MKKINQKIFIFVLIGISIPAVFELLLTPYYNLRDSSRQFVIPNEIFTILPEYKSPYIYINKPHTDMKDSAGKLTSTTNNFGMRGKDITETPRNETIRILSYGDSISFGARVNDAQCYPFLLEQSLNTGSSLKYEVLNMIRGYCPSIYAMHLKRDIFQFKPKYVIMEIELLNDISDEAPVKYKGLDEYGMPKKIIQARYWPGWILGPPMPEHPSFIEKLKLRRAHFSLRRKFGNLMNKIFPNPIFTSDSDTYYYNFGFDRYYLTEKRLSSAFDRMLGVIKAEQKFCNRNKIGFLLIIVPSKYVFYPNQYQKGAIRLFEYAEAKAKKLDIPYISLRQAFQDNGGPDLYFDFCHPTPKGYEIIAQKLRKYVESYIETSTNLFGNLSLLVYALI